MTEHKMTAKEWLKSRKIYDAHIKTISDSKRISVSDVMKEFALQVATEAVEEEKSKSSHVATTAWESFRMRVTLDQVIKNIKKRLNDE